jgi:tRNA A-37 threonylcarbamoyl transferase component Bud32
MSRPPSLPPVCVIESIPVQGDNEIPGAEARADGVPTPAHLRIERELGRGAMGHVHPAIDRNLLRHVALKRLDKEYADSPLYRNGFIAEAQITGQLEHPNIVPVHELSIDERGVPFFTMKLVQGVSFAHWLETHPLGTERLERGLEILLKVCDAVAYAHHRGVIHRDIKPDNVMVAEFGQVYLMDWGLARLTKNHPASSAHTDQNGPVGTPAYMAPEQARGVPSEMDERTDVFGLGALLYELVTGQLLYGKPAPARVIMLRAHLGQIVSLDLAAPSGGIPRRLQSIIEHAIDPEPSKRYPGVVEFQHDLRAFLRGGFYLPRRTFQPGELIVREGDMGDAAYMIVTGRCHAYRNVGTEKESLAVMTAGEVFGEMSLLLAEPRAASVEAVDTVSTLVLDQNTLTEGLDIDGWTGALVRALAHRFRDLEQQFRKAGLRRSRLPPDVRTKP